MIVRAWQATATAEGADAYREHFTRTVLPELQGIEGYRGAYLLRRDHDTRVQLQVLTVWESLEAIRSFAGANLENAVVEPAAQAALVSYDSTVAHHTVVVDTVGADARTGKGVSHDGAVTDVGQSSLVVGDHAPVIREPRWLRLEAAPAVDGEDHRHRRQAMGGGVMEYQLNHLARRSVIPGGLGLGGWTRALEPPA